MKKLLYLLLLAFTLSIFAPVVEAAGGPVAVTHVKAKKKHRKHHKKRHKRFHKHRRKLAIIRR